MSIAPRFLARFSAPVAAAVVAAASLLTAAPAQAQFGRGGGMMGGNWDEPTINSKEIERYAKIISMTPDQVENAKGMLEGFNTEYNAVRAEMRQAFESMRDEARESGDNSIWRDAGKLMQGFQKRVEKVETQYFDDVKLLLTEDQIAKWPAVERARRRDKSVPRGGLLSGESVDLIKIVGDLKLPDADAQGVQPLLDQYEADLDRVLEARDKAYEEGTSQGASLFMNQQMDKIDELFNKARDAAAKVKEVNKRYARQIEAGLPEDRRPDFEKEVRTASFPRVYRPNYVSRSFETALGLQDLTSEQRAQITQIKANYDQQMAPLQDKLAASIEETEMTRTAMQMMGMGGGGNEGSAELRDARREIEEGTFEKVRDALTEEQRAKLPERPQRGNWRNMVPGGGGSGAERPRRNRGGDGN